MVSTDKIIEDVKKEKENIYSFLRDIIAIPSFDRTEGDVIHYVKEKMENLRFDKVFIDPMGNVIGKIGNGTHVVAFDAHLDTVDTGNINDWSFDPFDGMEDDKIIGGRGACDQKGGMASMLYAAKLLLKYGVPDNLTIYFVGTVFEENYEGVSWKYIVEEDEIIPEMVISTEPTNMNVCIGHRGRTDILIEVMGKTAHGSMPWLGENAIERMADIIREIQTLSLRTDGFLGKGTITISGIKSEAPSKCAVPDKCSIRIDRRLTVGETPKSAVDELENLSIIKQYSAKVRIEEIYEETWTKYPIKIDCRFPAWKMSTDHILCSYALSSINEITGNEHMFTKWNFSTNGVFINGEYKIPCVGLGPGFEEQAHTIDEYTTKQQLLDATAAYILLIEKIGDYYK